MLELLLWGSLAMLAYIYVGYPLLIVALGKVFRRRINYHDSHPSITVVIAAYNEEKAIASTIDTILRMDYPAGLVDIIVASDASSDATDRIVADLAAPNVRLLRVEGRLGKTACQNAAAAAATGDWLVFVDATTTVDRNALLAMARNFSDPSIGCVAGRLVYIARDGDATGTGGTSYWGYETTLRLAESSFGSLIGVSGQLYAIRRSAYQPIPHDLISDFVVAMVMRGQDLRTVLEPDAVCYEDTLTRGDLELSMRVRVILRSLVALSTQRRFLNPLRFGAFAWQLWSHKVLRYVSPVFCITALLANLALAVRGEYVVLLALQLAAVAVGLLGFSRLPVLRTSRLLVQPYYFLLTNLASAIGLVRFLRGDKVVTWTPLR